MPAKPPEQPAQITPEMLAQLAEIMAAKEQAQRDARKAVWKQRWRAVWPSLVASGWTAFCLGSGVAIGIWRAGGIPIGPDSGGRNDVLQQSFEADRRSQVAILREYAEQGFANDNEGRLAATDWFNNNRFRNRSEDYKPYTNAVIKHFASGTLDQLANELEGKR